MLSSKFYEQQNCGIFLTNYLFKVMIWFVMYLFSNLSRWSSNVFKMVRNFDNFWVHQRSFSLFGSSIKKLLKVSFEVNKLKLQHWENYIFKNYNYCQWKCIKYTCNYIRSINWLNTIPMAECIMNWKNFLHIIGLRYQFPILQFL